MTTAQADDPRPMSDSSSTAAFARHQQDVRTALLMAGSGYRRADLAEWSTRVCTVATTMLVASGATVTATHGGSRRLLAASNFPARALDDAQGTLGEGPCIDVAADDRSILEPDLATDGAARWRSFTRLALARGVRGLFAFPLCIGAARLGVLAVYRDQPGTLTPRERWIASALADAATDALIDAGGPPPGGPPPGDPPPGGLSPGGPASGGIGPADLSGGAAAQDVLYQAQGMVMVDLRVTLTEAIARLRRYAEEQREKPGNVARRIVAGQVRLSQS